MSACTRFPDDDQVLRYVTNDLAEPELIAFEDHLFACDVCLARVERYQAAQHVLLDRALPAITTIVPSGAAGAGAGPARMRPWWLLGAVAASLVMVAAGLWSWQGRPASPVPQVAERPDPDAAVAPSSVRNAAALQVAVLAMVTPPPYLPITTRGEAAASTRFAAGMLAYTRADWTTASRTLSSVNTAEAHFYQGIADLMRGDAASAASALEAARTSGIQPYARESLFYLGKAALQRGDVTQARGAFTAARTAGASTEGEAARLLAALDDVTSGK